MVSNTAITTIITLTATGTTVSELLLLATCWRLCCGRSTVVAFAAMPLALLLLAVITDLDRVAPTVNRSASMGSQVCSSVSLSMPSSAFERLPYHPPRFSRPAITVVRPIPSLCC
jgi:hypothetical protein